ncbi:hypothetical protein M1N64_02345 [Peptococcaceae bacterium]|nr:hypothetical protein [Peptococcaceae bacterium]
MFEAKKERKIKMRKILCLLLVIALLATCTVKPVLASAKFEYVDIPVKVENNEVKTERMYGYFTEIAGVGEVFIVYHSDGTPTGKAWLPDAVVGELTEEKFIGYTPPGEPREILDFGNPIIVTAPGVLAGTAKIRIPNIPTDIGRWDTERDAFVTRNQAGVPLKGRLKYSYEDDDGRTYRPYTFLIPGFDPLYRLQVAEVTNPNLVTIKTTIRTNGNETELTLNSGETKTVLLDPIGDRSKQSLKVRVSGIISDFFPEMLRREDGALDIFWYSDYYRFPFARGSFHYGTTENISCSLTVGWTYSERIEFRMSDGRNFRVELRVGDPRDEDRDYAWGVGAVFDPASQKWQVTGLGLRSDAHARIPIMWNHISRQMREFTDEDWIQYNALRQQVQETAETLFKERVEAFFNEQGLKIEPLNVNGWGGRHDDPAIRSHGLFIISVRPNVRYRVIGDDGTIHRPAVYDNAWNLDTPLFTSELIEQNRSERGRGKGTYNSRSGISHPKEFDRFHVFYAQPIYIPEYEFVPDKPGSKIGFLRPTKDSPVFGYRLKVESSRKPRIYHYNGKLYVDSGGVNSKGKWVHQGLYTQDGTKIRDAGTIHTLPGNNPDVIYGNKPTGAEEVVFEDRGSYFELTKTFEAGKGGILSGAQRTLFYREDRDKSHEEAQIGFSRAPRATRLSYFNSDVPTGGQVVKSEDWVFGNMLAFSQNVKTRRLQGRNEFGNNWKTQ